MNNRMISNVILMSLFILTISNLTILSGDYKDTDSMAIFSFMTPVYAQSTSPGSDNSTDLGGLGNDPLAGLGLDDNSTNSTTPATAPSTTTNANSGTNAVPEFGSVAPIILIISIISIVVISSRNRLGFN